MSGDTIWDKIIVETVEYNKDALDIESENFKFKFQRRFLDNVQNWILQIFKFMENDPVKTAIWETKEKLDYESDEEGILSAIEQRKHAIFKNVLDWEYVKSLFTEESDDEEEEEEEEEEAEEDTSDNTDAGTGQKQDGGESEDETYQFGRENKS